MLPAACALAVALGSVTPSGEYRRLVADFGRDEAAFQKAYSAAKSDAERKALLRPEFGGRFPLEFYADKFQKFAEAHPKHPATLDAYAWLVSRIPDRPETTRVGGLVAEHWATDARLAKLCRALIYTPYKGTEVVLRAVLAKSPHRNAKGYASFALALSLARYADRLSGQPAAREPYETEAEALFQAVFETYADLTAPWGKPLGALADAELFQLKHLSIGKVAPDIAGGDLDGKAMTLADYRGKVTLVVFGDTGCPFCLLEVPDHAKLLARHAGKPFAIVGVNGDADRDKARAAFAAKGQTWRAFHDGPAGPTQTRWGITRWPTLYLIDAKGVVRYKGDTLRATGIRVTKDGKPEQFRYLDDAVDALVKEAEAQQPQAKP